jgi:hypothetical protein
MIFHGITALSIYMNIPTVKQGVSGDAYGVVQFWLVKSMFCFAKFEYISLITTASFLLVLSSQQHMMNYFFSGKLYSNQ